MARFPSLNGIERELFDVRKGHGLGHIAVEKINSALHLRAALGVQPDPDVAMSDQALEARDALIDYIADCDVLPNGHRLALTYVLNLDTSLPCYTSKLGARRLDLEQALEVGRVQRATIETSAIRILAEQLLKKPRSVAS